jgi:hypothetical protein
MTTARKDIRIVLSGKNLVEFVSAKRRAEKELGFALKDNDFARRLVLRGVGEVLK